MHTKRFEQWFTAYFLTFVFLDCKLLHVVAEVQRMLVMVPYVCKEDVYFIT